MSPIVGSYAASQADPRPSFQMLIITSRSSRSPSTRRRRSTWTRLSATTLQTTFLHRIRRRARILAQLRSNLQRPVWGPLALEWRLRGIVGVEPLADRLVRAENERVSNCLPGAKDPTGTGGSKIPSAPPTSHCEPYAQTVGRPGFSMPLELIRVWRSKVATHRRRPRRLWIPGRSSHAPIRARVA
jgi:hypothetical protein